ncbi:hypothetical protein B0J14DRAFT_680008 [Halenospora varia]|nr:hypothetical protein B0J14DRAFT_680008 [Halenospora varia]
MMAACVPGSALPEGTSVDLRKEGYKIGVMAFVGDINGVPYAFNGTAEQIFEAFKRDHPLDHAIAMTKLKEREASQLETRNKRDLNCCDTPNGPHGWPWEPAQEARIREGINYLRGLNGVCWVDRIHCTRISCSYDAGIYLCNDNDYPIQPSCTYLASYADDIANACVTYHKFFNGIRRYTCGQFFDTDNYNVCVHGDEC